MIFYLVQSFALAYSSMPEPENCNAHAAWILSYFFVSRYSLKNERMRNFIIDEVAERKKWEKANEFLAFVSPCRLKNIIQFF